MLDPGEGLAALPLRGEEDAAAEDEGLRLLHPVGRRDAVNGLLYPEDLGAALQQDLSRQGGGVQGQAVVSLLDGVPPLR